MDRERLKEVHKTDLTESRVNEDFVSWLKDKGPTWLLVGLLALTAYLGWVRWGESRQTHRTQAWSAFSEAQLSALPSGYESVAEQYPNVDAVATLARLRAAQRLVHAVQSDTPIAVDGDPGAAEGLSEADREQYLSRADLAYQRVLEKDDRSAGMTLHAVGALNGRAAVAESRGDTEAARQFYLAAAERARATYPRLAEQAETRAESVGDALATVVLAEQEADEAADDGRRPVTIDPALRGLVLPDDFDAERITPAQRGNTLPPGFQLPPGITLEDLQ